MRSVVLIHGLLRGMGREFPCEMLAMKETVASEEPVFSRCSVIEAPIDLPDGLYTVAFDHYVAPARKEAGLWLPNGNASALRIEERIGDAQTEEREKRALEVPSQRKNHVA
jgi:hypothetical protein